VRGNGAAPGPHPLPGSPFVFQITLHHTPSQGCMCVIHIGRINAFYQYEIIIARYNVFCCMVLVAVPKKRDPGYLVSSFVCLSLRFLGFLRVLWFLRVLGGFRGLCNRRWEAQPTLFGNGHFPKVHRLHALVFTRINRKTRVLPACSARYRHRSATKRCTVFGHPLHWTTSDPPPVSFAV